MKNYILGAFVGVWIGVGGVASYYTEQPWVLIGAVLLYIVGIVAYEAE